ncbi:MAG TPA: hypothetical protein VEU54_07980 [Steroidobacteraceae bacterium]|nr:hypothetical protein [Steroidobacteraceae bacterium]
MNRKAKSSTENPPEKQEAVELPTREALAARLEAQRAELLRAMTCVNSARRTLEEHVAKPPFGGVIALSPSQHKSYREQVLEALTDAGEALATAYPMLERVAEALDVEELLQQHAPSKRPPEESAATPPSTASRR